MRGSFFPLVGGGLRRLQSLQQIQAIVLDSSGLILENRVCFIDLGRDIVIATQIRCIFIVTISLRKLALIVSTDALG